MSSAGAVRRRGLLGLAVTGLPATAGAQSAPLSAKPAGTMSAAGTKTAEAPPVSVAGGAWGWFGSLGLGTAAIGLLTFVAPRMWEQAAARLAQRRAFEVETTKRVVDLAWKHYWGLANAAGTLAGLLRSYLDAVEAHLLLRYDRPEHLQQRMRELAEEATKNSYPSLIRLVVLFHRFQFQGSNTYLLPQHGAGETLRRLYNRFVISLGDDFPLGTIRLAVERRLAGGKPPEPENSASGSKIEGEKDRSEVPTTAAAAGGAEKVDAPKPRPTQEEIWGAWLENKDERARSGLDAPFESWQSWMERALPAVDQAAEALEGFAHLIEHELATLHAVFFRDGRDARGWLSPLRLDVRGLRRDAASRIVGSSDWAASRWPHLLDEEIMLGLARADHFPRAFAVLGAVASLPRSSTRPDPTPAPNPTPDVHESTKESSVKGT